jgi:hypothetical protein
MDLLSEVLRVVKLEGAFNCKFPTSSCLSSFRSKSSSVSPVVVGLREGKFESRSRLRPSDEPPVSYYLTNISAWLSRRKCDTNG